MTNKFYKTLAITLAAITFSLPLSAQALAAGPNDGHKAPSKVEQRHQPQQKHEIKKTTPAPKHEVKKATPAPEHEVKKPAPAPKHEVKKPAPAPRHEAPKHNAKSVKQEESHSDVGNLITGGIIGLVLGAIIANNA